MSIMIIHVIRIMMSMNTISSSPTLSASRFVASSHVASSELVRYGDSLCNGDSHMKITPRGCWVRGEENFSGRFAESHTTHFEVLRVWTCNNTTHWTLEQWEHDNGYRVNLVVLSKAEFLSLLNS